MDARHLITVAIRAAGRSQGLVAEVSIRRDTDAPGTGHAEVFALAEGDRLLLRWQELDAAAGSAALVCSHSDDDAACGASVSVLPSGPTELELRGDGWTFRTNATEVRAGLLCRAPKGHIDRPGHVHIEPPRLERTLVLGSRWPSWMVAKSRIVSTTTTEDAGLACGRK